LSDDRPFEGSTKPDPADLVAKPGATYSTVAPKRMGCHWP